MNYYDESTLVLMGVIEDIKKEKPQKEAERIIGAVIRSSIGEVDARFDKQSHPPEHYEVNKDLFHIVRFLVFRHMDYISLDVLENIRVKNIVRLFTIISIFPTKDLAYFKTRLGSEEGKKWLQRLGLL